MEVLQFAITMEKDGEAYYRAQSAKNSGNALKVVFDMLADDEARHARILQDIQNDVPYKLEDESHLQNRMNLFKSAADYQEGVAGQADQAELYHTAFEMEKKSIDLYRNMREQATDDVSRHLFDFLVKEETDHYDLLEELTRHVSRPKDWVESAEFGVREEY